MERELCGAEFLSRRGLGMQVCARIAGHSPRNHATREQIDARQVTQNQRRDNPESRKQRQQHYQQNRDEILVKHKVYYQQNRDEILVKLREHPERHRFAARQYYRRQAIKRDRELIAEMEVELNATA